MSIKKILQGIFGFLYRIIFRFNLDDQDRVTPMNDSFGYRRGTPIDRYYIQNAIKEYSKEIKGSVLEVGGNDYTMLYSNTSLKDSHILNYTHMDGNNVIVGDLTKHDSLKEQKFDTFICTQTLNFIYDFESAISTSYELLNNGGYFIGTVASVSNISKYDNDRWGDYWRFTEKGIKKALDNSQFQVIDLSGFGNVLAAKSMFDGCVIEDFKNLQLLDHVDPAYPVIISFLCFKK